MHTNRSIVFFNKKSEKLEKEMFFKTDNLSDLLRLFKAEENDPNLIFEYEINLENSIFLEKSLKLLLI